MPWPTFKTQEDVPEAFRGEYEERDGEWVAKQQAQEGDGLGDKGKKALEDEREARKAAEKRARDAEAARAKAEEEAKAHKAGLTSAELEALRADVRKTVEAEYAERFADYEPTKNENRELKLDSKVKAIALGDKGGVRQERVDQWWKLHKDEFDLTSDGKPMVKGKPGVEVEQYIAGDLKKATPEFYKGTQAAGGGAAGIQGAGHSAALSLDDFRKLSPAEQLKWSREHEQK